jgi:hypothetical protein
MIPAPEACAHVFPVTLDREFPEPDTPCLLGCGTTHAEHEEVAEVVEMFAPLGEDQTPPVPLGIALLTVREALKARDTKARVIAYVEDVLTSHGYDLAAIDVEPDGGPSRELDAGEDA